MTDNDIKEMRRLHKYKHHSVTDLAKHFNVSVANTSKIVNNLIHVDKEYIPRNPSLESAVAKLVDVIIETTKEK
jgi:DNA-binding MarR family transcriptional regulator